MKTFKFKAISELTLSHKPGQKTSGFEKCEFQLQPDKILIQEAYLKNGELTYEGTKATTQCFVQALVGNIDVFLKEWKKKV